MISVTADEMRLIDRYAIDTLGIPSILLMENAALRTIEKIDLARRHSFAVFCGVGNNGGDGLAIARGLLALGKKVYTFIVGDREKMTEEFRINYGALERIGEIYWVETLGDLDLLNEKLDHVNTIVDCLFGTGLNRDIRGTAVVVIEQINRSRIFTLSVDVPSGLNATTGESFGAVVDASEVICLQYMKTGLIDSRFVHCPVHVVPIGIPALAYERVIGEGVTPEKL